MKVEIILADENNYWTSEVVDVPKTSFPFAGPDWRVYVMDWVERNLLSRSDYRKVVYIGILDPDPEGKQASG